MKKLILFLLLLCIQSYNSTMNGQSCDPIMNQFTYNDICLVGSTTELTVGWTIGGSDNTCVTPAGSWQVVISFPATEQYGIDDVSAVTDPSLFTWIYDPVNTTLTGTNNVDINWFEEGNILVNIKPKAINSCFPVSSNVNIQIVSSIFGGSPGSFSNNTGNDELTEVLGVDELLPIELTYFRSNFADCESASLAWQTASEINNEGFLVERSIDGRSFEEVDFVKGNNNSNRLIDYTFSDDISEISRNSEIYYRLKQIDFDGGYEYSDIIVIKSDCLSEATFNVYPNPVITYLNIAIDGDIGVVSEILITNSLNQTLYTISEVNDNLITIDMTTLQSGVYFINAIDNNGKSILTKKIINLGR